MKILLVLRDKSYMDTKQKLDYLSRIKSQIDTQDKWTTHAMARGADGHPTAYNDKAATCWCLVGALRVVIPSENDGGEFTSFLSQELKQFLPEDRRCDVVDETGICSCNISTFNDRSNHKEVMTALDTIIENVK